MSRTWPPRSRASVAVALVCTLALVLAGCGAGGSANVHSAARTGVPGYVTTPFTAEQKLIEQGARLVVSDGCAACHLDATAPGFAPDFNSFAGHRVSLRDGRSVLVDESFVREGLLDPAAAELAGFDPAPMLAALAHLHLTGEPAQVRALAAFIEQVGPET